MMAEGEEKIYFENHVIQLLEKMEKIPKSAKEVFLWDLIRISRGDLYDYRSNLADKTKVDEEELCIRLVTNEENKSLSIIDTGIGMTKDELIDGIGKISEDQVIEYKGIIDQYLMKGDPDAYRVPDSSFCLGVYSAFMVAHKVVISTKKNGHDPYVWESKASDGFFRIAPAPAPDTNGDDKLDRGTKVTLYLNPDDFKYLEESTLRVLANKHTFDLCPYPIYVSAEDEREKKRQRTAGAKEREEELKRFQEEFWGLQQLCEEALKGLVKEVVVNDRVFDLPSGLSADTKRFEINPRSPIMKSLLEEYNRDPEGERERLVDTFKVHYFLHIIDTRPSYFAEPVCIDSDDDDTSLNDQVECGTSSTT